MTHYETFYIDKYTYKESDPYNFSSIFLKLGIQKGDIKDISNIPDDFCRDPQNPLARMEHPITTESLIWLIETLPIIIYKKEYGKQVAGICTLAIHMDKHTILLNGICVPNGEEKGLGTSLINDVKNIATKLNACIKLDALPPVQQYYIDRGFINKGSGASDMTWTPPPPRPSSQHLDPPPPSSQPPDPPTSSQPPSSSTRSDGLRKKRTKRKKRGTYKLKHKVRKN